MLILLKWAHASLKEEVLSFWLVPHYPPLSLCGLTLQQHWKVSMGQGPSLLLPRSVLFTSRAGENSVNSMYVSAVTGIQSSGIQNKVFPGSTHRLASSLPSACLRQIALQVRTGTVLSCLLGQGLESRLGQEAGAPPFPRKRGAHSSRTFGILPCWRNWFPGPESQAHLLGGPGGWDHGSGAVYFFLPLC